ncbi:MAG: hypothetical protein PWR25_267 [Euryarchaeota archaeon]|jgi:TPP-dependent 2-oxoacid decarboxylase|nr:hypothetical protein [Euryarchaeota archaeon]MDN5339513.1 hypothetical protein [Euryarchaeota archaeon]
MTQRSRPLIALLLAALALAVPAGAIVVENADLSPAEVQLLFAMREYTLTYNEYADRLPGWVTGPFADEKVNLYITSPDGVLVIGVMFHDKKIVQFDAKGSPDPIATVTADAATVEEVMVSERPFDTFRAAIRNGTATIEGNNLIGTLRTGMVRFGFWAMDVIGL